MFSEMIANLKEGVLPDPAALRSRFDIALTKKMGVVRLPPAFWMDDPKINPRSDHLFWAALLMRDRQRIELALAVLAEELDKSKSSGKTDLQEAMSSRTKQLLDQLFECIGDAAIRSTLRKNLERLVPEWQVKEEEAPDD